MNKTEIGNKAELKACEFLTRQHLQIIKTNFKALPYGEIDIIAIENDILVFVEVKYRKSNNFGYAQEMITPRKQSKIINTANIFLQRYPLYENKESRFDVIAINNTNINWIKNAFQLN